ncbi:MAG TPA: glycogen synthase [Steroidobacteraceae bacterium]|nr:glycogen synthase [Steroidobacteraceae bacterium]
MPYRVLFVSAEYAPLAKTGGLADVSTALTRFLYRRGDDVRVFVPYYRRIAERGLALAPVEFLQGLELALGTHRYRYRILTGAAPGSDLPLYFVDCPALYDRPEVYSADADEHRRFLLLTRAALECAQRMGFAPHVLHCNDWHTAFGPLLLKSTYAWDRLFEATRSVLTIHNIGYQGVFGAAHAPEIGLGAATTLLHQDDLKAGRINSMLHGILYADLVTTVSPTYAREICTPEYSLGLDPFLRARGDRLVGILNGVDYDEWDPAHDPYLPLHYTPGELAGKAALKRLFLERTGLSAGTATPLFGIVSRLVVQKGIDLLIAVLPGLLRASDASLVALGSGEQRFEDFFARLEHAFPGRVMFHRGYSEELAHWIEAASDAFLMPSRYEPCGLNQMYSLRYGTVPIVRRTGGLADSVSLYSPAHGSGTGIVFEHYDAAGLRWAIDEALTLYRQPVHWKQLVANAMAQDYSWERQGALYIDEYRRLVGPD